MLAMPPIQVAWYWFIRSLARFLYFVPTGGFRVRGKHLVPRNGALIVAPNHSSYLDPPAIGCSLPRRVTFMAKEELFESRAFGWLIRSLGAFPVRRGAGDMESIRMALKILESESAILVFPEGTRNYGEHMMPINRGVELLAKRSGAWILPAAIVGTARKWPKGKRLRFWGRVTVRFGEPYRIAELSAETSFAADLERRILELCHEEGYSLIGAPDKKTMHSSVEGRPPIATEPPRSDETPAQT